MQYLLYLLQVCYTLYYMLSVATSGVGVQELCYESIYEVATSGYH
jgi:hypothetical protein